PLDMGHEGEPREPTSTHPGDCSCHATAEAIGADDDARAELPSPPRVLVADAHQAALPLHPDAPGALEHRGPLGARPREEGGIEFATGERESGGAPRPAARLREAPEQRTPRR